MAGIVGQYVTNPRFRFVVSQVTIAAVAGVNPVDLTPQSLPNMRGQLMIQGTSADDSYTWSLQVQGGVGEFAGGYSRNFYYVPSTAVNCTVTMITPNRVRVETPVGDAGGRIYFFQFYPATSVGPTVQQTSTNVLTGDLTVKIAKTVFVPA